VTEELMSSRPLLCTQGLGGAEPGMRLGRSMVLPIPLPVSV
jgi:hypothetical protein